MLQKMQKHLRRNQNLFTTSKLSLLLEALSNCDNLTVITILYNNDVLTWHYKNNNKYQVTMSYQSYKTVRRSVYHLRLTKIASTVI